MVNTEQTILVIYSLKYYNILNIVVNTELMEHSFKIKCDYNILNIVVNTELPTAVYDCVPDYNILNIVVNTEHKQHR